MSLNIPIELHAKDNQYLLNNNGKTLAIKQFSISEMQRLYEAIQSNIKIVNNLFAHQTAHETKYYEH